MDLKEIFIHGLSGSISGMAAIIIWYPLDNLRMRIQSEDLSSKSKDEIKISNDQADSMDSKHNKLIAYLCAKFESLNKLIKFLRNHKIVSLYDGMSSAVVGSVISYGIYFLNYQAFKNIMTNLKFDKGIVINSMITAFLAACSVSIVTNPIWVLNSRMALTKKESKSNWEMIKQILKEEGVGGFFKGLVPSLALTTNPVIQFIIYEFLKEKIMLNGRISSLEIILLSILSKFATTLATYPILTIKTLFQANESKTNKEIIDILQILLKNEGVRGFYKGIGAKIIQTLINNVIVMLTFEKIQKIIRRLA